MSKSKHVTNCRKRRKIALVDACGDKCQICGLTFPPSVYDFHHINPKEKEIGISNSENASLENIITEVKKCILVCRNCHALIEGGYITELPVSNFDEGAFFESMKKQKGIVDKPIKNKKNIRDILTKDILENAMKVDSLYMITIKFNTSYKTLKKLCKEYNIEYRKDKQKKQKGIPSQSVCVSQYDLENNLLKTFNSFMDASRYLKKNNFTTDSNSKSVATKVSLCCRGKRKTAYGFIWKYN